MIWRHAPVAWEQDDDVVYVAPVASPMLELRGSAALVWLHLDGRTADEVAAAVAESVGMSASELAADIVMFLNQLEDRGLTTRVAE